MMSQRAKVIEGGKLVLPAKLRRAAGIEPGDTVTVELRDGILRIVPLAAWLAQVRAIAASLTPPGEPSVVDELIADRRAEAARDADGELGS